MTNELIVLALSVIDKIIDRTPNYKEKIKERKLKLVSAYLEEKAKPNHLIDDNKLNQLHVELVEFLKEFKNEIL